MDRGGKRTKRKRIEEQNLEVSQSLTQSQPLSVCNVCLSCLFSLKSLTIDIGHEVREHNKILRDVDDGFDSTSGFLQKNINNVLKLARSGSRFGFIPTFIPFSNVLMMPSNSRYHLFYLFLFAIFVFVVIWLLK